MKKLILILMIIGGINWGLVGFFNYNLVSSIFGVKLEVISRIIYAVVGLAALYGISFYSKTKQDTHKIRAAIKNTVSGIMPETVFFWFKIRLPQCSSQLPSAPD